eukprot:EG_transcript_35613
MAVLRAAGLPLDLPPDVGELAATLFRQFQAAHNSPPDLSPANLSLELLLFLVNDEALEAAGHGGVVLLAALVHHIHTEVFHENDVHCFDADDLVAVPREALLAAWYGALAWLADHGVPAPQGGSALMAAAAGGGVRLGVTFGGQGKAWLPLLRHLWDVYRPV